MLGNLLSLSSFACISCVKIRIDSQILSSQLELELYDECTTVEAVVKDAHHQEFSLSFSPLSTVKFTSCTVYLHPPRENIRFPYIL